MSFPFDLVIFAASGFLLKASDFLGEKNQDRVLSIGLSLLAAGFFWLLMKSNADYSTVLLAIVIGSLLSRKVDRLNLFLGLGLLVTLMAVFGFALPILLPLVILSISATVDEWGNDRKWQLNVSYWFFRYRGMMKVLAIILWLASQISFSTIAGFLLFDVTYDITSVAIERRTSSLVELTPQKTV